MKEKQDIEKSMSVLSKILSKLRKPLGDWERPKDIPPSASDCGWNHGKPKDKK
jgi:hypothetical protein